MAKSATIGATLVATDEASPPDIGNVPKWTGSLAFSLTLAEGVDAGQFDLAYIDDRTVGDGADDDIDLAGVLSTVFGDTIDAAGMVALMIINKPRDGSENTTDLTIGAEPTNPWAGLLGATGTVGPIKPGGMFMAAAGDADGIGAVVAATGDILRVTNSAGASADYQIAILARSA